MEEMVRKGVAAIKKQWCFGNSPADGHSCLIIEKHKFHRSIRDAR